MKLIFLGPPGVGKGTQAVRVSDRYGLEHISTGELLRFEIAQGTNLGHQVETLINRGELVGDALMAEILKRHLEHEKLTSRCDGGYILDGYPRTLAQAQGLPQITSVDAAIYYDAADDELVRRLSQRRVCPKCRLSYTADECHDNMCKKCGTMLKQRDDDRPDVVRERLRVYEEQTLPIIDYYNKQGLLFRVDAAQSVDEVFEETVRELSNLNRGVN